MGSEMCIRDRTYANILRNTVDNKVMVECVKLSKARIGWRRISNMLYIHSINYFCLLKRQIGSGCGGDG